MDQAAALGLTLLCEVPMVVALSRPRPLPRTVLVAAGASLLTHPLAWFVAMRLSPQDYPAGLAVIEAAVVLVEACWLYAWLRPHPAMALGWSLLANGASFLAGVVLLS